VEVSSNLRIQVTSTPVLSNGTRIYPYNFHSILTSVPTKNDILKDINMFITSSSPLQTLYNLINRAET